MGTTWRTTWGTSFIRCLSLIGAGAILLTPVPPARAETCVVKGGSATGITRGFAEYEALLIIRQVTGNWPIETDRVGTPTYSCKQDGVFWTCRATAKVCKA
jgi:hypothetical protein